MSGRERERGHERERGETESVQQRAGQRALSFKNTAEALSNDVLHPTSRKRFRSHRLS